MNWHNKTQLQDLPLQGTSHETIIQLLLESRGLRTKEEQDQFFNPKHPNKISLSELEITSEAMNKAVSRIQKAIDTKEKVVIYGDYDADGVSATAVMWHGLATLGVPAIPFIPHREKHGYGLSQAGIDEILEKHQPDLIITVDNGIVAHEPAKYVASKNIDLIITDHHQTDGQVPEATSIIHSDKVCGTAIAWVFVRELFQHFHRPQKLVEELLDLVAIGTIADMMPMIGLNRSLATYGLEVLTTSQRPGIVAMKEEAGIAEGTTMSTYHVGFVLGPRINAMGRIDHGTDALRLLCLKDVTKARELAIHLGETNKDRQDITVSAVELAMEMYEKDEELQQQHIIVIEHEEFHEGVVGLVAGKLVEKYHKPAIVISKGKTEGKGSARSVSGVNIIELIRSVDSYLLGAGGHPGAAGLSVANSKFGAFKKAIEAKALEVIDKELLVPSLSIDLEIPLEVATLELYEKLQAFAPFGIGNNRPVFASDVEIVDHRLIGKQSTHLKMTVSASEEGSLFVDSIGFGMHESASLIEQTTNAKIAYTIDKNEWRGNTSLQLVLKGIEEQNKDFFPETEST